MTVIQLWTKNRPIAYGIARDFYIPGADRDDVTQEALIALWVAARDYQPESGPFRSFAALVIKRRLGSCVKMAQTYKHAALSTAVRTILSEDGDRQEIAGLLPYLHQVTDVVEDRERLALIIAAIKSDLTEFERECIVGIASGKGYLELGPYKKVDNALFRARRKLKLASDTGRRKHE
jgi:RNA polymerase sporulation-specific sigma factor